MNENEVLSRLSCSALCNSSGNSISDGMLHTHETDIDVFNGICHGLGLSGGDLVALIDCYSDASGSSDQTNIAVGAYVSTVEKWNKFKPLWNRQLEAEGVEYFRRSQMEYPFHGAFEELGWTKKYQVPVVRRLQTIIKGHTIKGAAKSVRIKAFAQMMPSKIKEVYGGPFGWCVLLNLVDIGLWARQLDHWVSYVFETGDEGQGQIMTAIDKLYRDEKSRELLRIASWSFAPKKGPNAVIQLQAADFIAYESYKDIVNYLAPPEEKRDPRLSRKHLIRPRIDQLNFWADEAISNWLVNVAKHDGNVIDSLITGDSNS
jgi:hypothetical protein